MLACQLRETVLSNYKNVRGSKKMSTLTIFIGTLAICFILPTVYLVFVYGNSLFDAQEPQEPQELAVTADMKLVETIIRECRHLPPAAGDNPGALGILLLHMTACRIKFESLEHMSDKAAYRSWIQAFDKLSGAFVVYASFSQIELD